MSDPIKMTSRDLPQDPVVQELYFRVVAELNCFNLQQLSDGSFSMEDMDRQVHQNSDLESLLRELYTV